MSNLNEHRYSRNTQLNIITEGTLHILQKYLS